MAIIPENVKALAEKYRPVLLVVLLGVVLMLWPTGAEKQSQEPVATVQQPALENQLEEILSQLAGAGKVRVLLTQDSGEQTIYQQNESRQTGTNTQDYKQDTVTVSGADRQQQGLVRYVNAPVYRGAVVVSQGGDNPAVRLAIVNAVSSVTGLASNRITVLKMK